MNDRCNLRSPHSISSCPSIFSNSQLIERIANVSQFTGRENDGAGLYYYRARYYSPDWQRFASEDRSGFAGGLNPYAYGADQPTLYTDSMGLKPSSGFGHAPGWTGPEGGQDGSAGPSDPSAPPGT
jgi:RHS repeat-associated protein